MAPFALTLTRQPQQPPRGPAFRYDAAQQLNLLASGRPAVSVPTPLCWTATKSTAGSKVHKDDTDDAG